MNIFITWLRVNYNMNLQEQINRIQSMIFINESNAISFLNNSYDKVFDKLTPDFTYDVNTKQMEWYNEKGKKVFERNHWGMFWIYNCDLYSELSTVPKLMTFSFKDFEKSLIDYLNKRYETLFSDRPLKEIGNEKCPEYDEL